MYFSEMGLSPMILKAISAQGYDTPTAIQAQAIPAILDNRDLLAAAQTGTGKTAGFTLPVLQRLLASNNPVRSNQVRALVLTPTRELAMQVSESVDNYGQFLRMRSGVVFGGVKINPQMQKLCKGMDVLVATPGRLLDLYNQNAVKFEQLEILVLDEADRMLDMGFIHDIRKIIRLLPKKRQNLMFSATFSEDIKTLAKTIVVNPVEVSVTPSNQAAPSVKQWIIPVDKGRKPALLVKIIKDNNWQQVLVFSKTKHGANRLAKKLDSQGISAAAIHGNKSQAARVRALSDFKNGDVQVLVATDIAARGLDISRLPHVINFDLPNVAADYVHRIGRTGRAGEVGEAVSFVCHEDIEQLADVQNLIGEILERNLVEGFEPVKLLPKLALNTKPKKIKKPKKPKVKPVEAEQEKSITKKPKATPKNKPNPKQSSESGKKWPHSSEVKPHRRRRRSVPGSNSAQN